MQVFINPINRYSGSADRRRLRRDGHNITAFSITIDMGSLFWQIVHQPGFLDFVRTLEREGS
jgi:hypothetical protein